MQDNSPQSALNNITTRLTFEEEDFYLLIKKQQSGEHWLLFVTDLHENFWIKKITYDYLVQLKDDLKIRTSNKVFIDHLIYGIKENCRILRLHPYADLMIKLKISDGLVMSCKIRLDSHINIDEKLNHFKSVLKLFGKQFYQAKDYEVKLSKSCDSKKIDTTSKSITNRQQNSSLPINNHKLFSKPEKKLIPEKHRDLINPYRKKRRTEGMKLSRNQASDEQK